MRTKQTGRTVRWTRWFLGLFLLAGTWSLVTDLRADEAEKKPTIKEVMKKAHKKPDELLKKVATGMATDAQKQELLKLYKAMAEATPPKGDETAWKEKTKLLVDAAEAAVQGNPDAPRRLTTASNCMSCHKDHK